ncbi:MAG: alpha/beta hydrolase [Phycisphaerae bacterium]|nr:alpha/beta hydrolase [Phycisphaerae bacterium]
MATFIHLLHLPLVLAYLTAPMIALGLDIRSARRQGRLSPSPGYVGTLCAGIALGTGVCVTYAFAVGGRADPAQVALASFFAAGMLFLLKGFDFLLRRFLMVMAREWLIVPAALLRALLLFGLGLPYILAAGLTYRPKIIGHDDPQSKFGYSFDSIAFQATDGVHLSGWWIPASERSSTTVVLCHGPGIGKSTLMSLCQEFVPQGFNVLLFDFRAHGQSGGQITTFGDLERRDVLGAVQWLRAAHPDESRKIDGLGVETGAAALVAAAASDDPAGRAIDALALYDPYDDLTRLSRKLAKQRFLPPMNWLFAYLSVPLADWQTGADLSDFSPARLIDNVWPRPVFVIDAVDDPTFTFEAARRLFDATSGPKQRRWVNDANNGQLIGDAATAAAVRNFFRRAHPLPVI